jgi:acyl carrier protein
MERSALLDKTLQHIGEFLEQDVSHLTLDTRLDSAAPGMDSLKIFELMLYLEESFGVDFDESSMADVATIGELIERIDAAAVAKVGSSPP